MATKKVTVTMLKPGPRKQELRKVSIARVTTHKNRAHWFQSRATWPLREASALQLNSERARADRKLAAVPGAARWQMVGPSNIGGRCTCVSPHPNNPDDILIGSAAGGVWKSTDAGQTWKPLWHKRDLNVGAIARDPTHPNVVYVGTGEANLSADSYPGVGLYRSDNDGKTWKLIASVARAGIPARIGTIAVDPFDSNHIFLGGVTHGGGNPAGLFVTRDGGSKWQRLTFVSPNDYFCHHVVFHPMQQDVVYTTVNERGARNGIWRSGDGGATWTQLTAGLPSPDRFGRTSLAIAPSRPQTIYALAAQGFDALLGVFRSDDGGDHWRDITNVSLRTEGQMGYGNTIVVHPQNHEHIIFGGVDLHRTQDGGTSWHKISRWNANRGDSNYAHADHHGLVMLAGAPRRVYDANDGGMDLSEDGGSVWTNRSNGLACNMFYDMDVAPSDGTKFGGGAQDNGTLVTNADQQDKFFELLGGDGGWMVYNPNNAGDVYCSFQFLGIYRIRGGNFRDISPNVPEDEQRSVWMAYVATDPRDFETVYAGSQRVLRSKNGGLSWVGISPVFDSSPITAINVASADSKRLYVGTENGGFFRSIDSGVSWSANLASATLPGKTITRVDTHPQNVDRVYLTVASSGNPHVFRSDDGGITWQDIDGGSLPDVPHQAVVVRPDNPDEIFIGNDAGVYASMDAGTTWRKLTRNLPDVPVVDLVYHLIDRTLTAATYGRSVWRIKLA